MKTFIAGMVLAAAAAVSATPVALVNPAPTYAYAAGFNMGAQNTDGSCKSTSDWERDFKVVKGWSNGNIQFNTIKLFSTNDCDTLKNAVPAAQTVGVKIWAGVWAVDKAKFTAEKNALEAAIRAHGYEWLAGINVGSESLYRKEITAQDLASQIYDVKGMVQLSLGATTVPVGCADTWTMWVHPDNAPVIEAVDVVMMNGFPYWQGATIKESRAVFQESIKVTNDHINGKPFIVGESGWPTKGPNFVSPDTPGTGPAVPSVDNSQSFWTEAGCWLISQKIPFFWFSAFDEPNRTSEIEQNFGVATPDQKLKISLTCSY